MKYTVRMLEDYYYEGGKHEVWWKGDIKEIDEVSQQVSVEYLTQEGICEILDGE